MIRKEVAQKAVNTILDKTKEVIDYQNKQNQQLQDKCDKLARKVIEQDNKLKYTGGLDTQRVNEQSDDFYKAITNQLAKIAIKEARSTLSKAERDQLDKLLY